MHTTPARHVTLRPRLEQALSTGDAAAIAEVLRHQEPADVADVLASLETDDALLCLTAMGLERRIETFSRLPPDRQAEIIERLELPVLTSLLDGMSSNDRARCFRRLPEATRERLLPLLAQAERNDLARLMSFGNDSAGAIMSTEYAALPPDMAVTEALAELRRVAPRRETIYTLFCVDGQGRLIGALALLDLITAPPERRVRDLMDADVLALPADADREEVARSMAKYGLSVLPIVGPDRRLLGIVTADDAFDVLEQEDSEDVQLASGIAPDAYEGRYSRASAAVLVRRRLLWLLGLLVFALLSAAVVSAFKETLAATVALAFFIPVVTGSGGNTGTQSATLVIRALAVGDVTPRDWIRIFTKELLVGAMLGVCLAAAIYAIGLVWPGAGDLAPVVGTTMVVVVLWANLVGALLPLALRRVGADPAVAGAPLVGTLVDASGLLIYFGMARLWLSR